MEITAQWFAVVLTAVGMGAGAGVYVERRIQQARSAMPIIRTEWKRGSQGFWCRIEFVNRLDEDLVIDRAEAAKPFAESTPTFDSGGSVNGFTYESYPSPRNIGLAVAPKSSGKLELRVEGPDTPAWLRITISSSHRTLRSKRVTLRPTEKL